ncbi:MAG: hypothetical protein ACK4WH_11650 [Phycisphaerales bacterium]
MPSAREVEGEDPCPVRELDEGDAQWLDGQRAAIHDVFQQLATDDMDDGQGNFDTLAIADKLLTLWQTEPDRVEISEGELNGLIGVVVGDLIATVYPEMKWMILKLAEGELPCVAYQSPRSRVIFSALDAVYKRMDDRSGTAVRDLVLGSLPLLKQQIELAKSRALG